MKILILSISLQLFLSGCCRSQFDIMAEFKKANDVYFGDDMVTAGNQLSIFVGRAEQNEAHSRAIKGVNYDAIMAMSFLKLSSVQRAENVQDRAEYSLDRSIIYFERIESIANDPVYKRNRKEMLEEFLRKSESVEFPAWKRRLKLLPK